MGETISVLWWNLWPSVQALWAAGRRPRTCWSRLLSLCRRSSCGSSSPQTHSWGVGCLPNADPPPPDLLFALSPSLHGRAAMFVETFHSKHNAGSIIVVTVNDAVSLAANPQPEGARRLVSVTLTAVFSGSSRRCCGSGDSLTGSTQTEIGTGRGHEMAFGTFFFLPASRQYPPPPLPPPDCCQGNTRRGSGEMQCTCAVELSPQSNIFFCNSLCRVLFIGLNWL